MFSWGAPSVRAGRCSCPPGSTFCVDKRTLIYSRGASPVWVDGGSPCYLRDHLLLLNGDVTEGMCSELGLSEKEEEMESHAGSGAKV